MKKTVIALVAASMLASITASSQTDIPSGLSYDYIEGNIAFYPSYGSGPEGSGGSQDYFGPRVRGSVSLIPEVFLFGQFRYLTDSIDFTQAHGGVGYRHEVAQDIDVYVGGGLEYVRFSNGGSIDDFGFGFRGGLRQRLNEDFEIGGELRYVNIGGDLDFDYVGVVGTVQYFLNEQVGLIGELDVEDGELGLLAGMRWSF